MKYKPKFDTNQEIVWQGRFYTITDKRTKNNEVEYQLGTKWVSAPIIDREATPHSPVESNGRVV